MSRNRIIMIVVGLLLLALAVLALQGLTLNFYSRQSAGKIELPSSAPPPAAAPAPMPVPAPAPAPPTPADYAYRALRDEVARMADGRIAYNPPPRMRVGEEEEVTIKIARNELAQTLTERMAGRGQPVTEDIQVGNFMRVQLDGGDAFRITPKEPQDRAIPPNGVGEWLFRVLPVKAGEKQVLRLNVYVRVQVPGREELISQPVLRREIAVEVNYWWDIAELWRENWKWFLGGLGTALAAVAGYLLKRWWERRDGGAAG